jgi:CheY-like chemotaxis protein
MTLVKSEIVLLGHQCPLDIYPGPVVPIGTLDRKLVAVYYHRESANQSPIIEALSESCHFVRHSDPDHLPPFNPVRDRLFALSQDDLRIYSARARSQFYLKLLRSPGFARDNPYLRFALAKVVGDNNTIQHELASCRIDLLSVSPDLPDMWYSSISDFKRENVRTLKSARRKKICRILVVEDDVRMLQAIVEVLRFEGYKVITARDGQEALVKMDTRYKPGLILLDAMLPELNGYEVSKRIRADLRWKYVPIIMMTALGQAEDKQRAVEVGVNAYLRKPFDLSELLEQITLVVR